MIEGYCDQRAHFQQHELNHTVKSLLDLVHVLAIVIHADPKS